MAVAYVDGGGAYHGVTPPDAGVRGLPIDVTSLGGQPADSDLTTIAGLTATTDNFIAGAANAWASRTPVQARASLGLGVPVITVFKATTESRQSVTVTAADAALLFAAAANSEYVVSGLLLVDGAAAADFKVGIFGPAGTTGQCFFLASSTAVAAVAYTPSVATVLVGVDSPALGTVAVGTIIAVPFQAYVKTVGTAGNVTLNWAQNTSTASNTSINQGSYLDYRKVV